MLSIKSLYNVGYGPSSSHTMGPAYAAKIIKKQYPFADSFEVILYNSLALTGEGHLTYDVIRETLSPKEVKFQTVIDPLKHPNTLIFKVFCDEKLIETIPMASVGGGRVIFSNQDFIIEPSIYQLTTFESIKKYCQTNNMTLYDFVVENEGEDIIAYLKDIWKVMKKSINNGLTAQGLLPGKLKLKRKAHDLYSNAMKNEPQEITERRLISAYAYAVSEENASGGIIVTAPTCGACGVLPAVLYYMKEHHKMNDIRIVRALATAGLIGNLIKHNASISGAEAGCQAEIGSACSMAAAAHASLFKYSLDQIEYAAEIAIEHHLGLTCDPVNGYVQIPCIERNAVAALRAVDASGLSYFLSDSRKISFDLIVKTMYQTGLDMDSKYKETSEAGLAVFCKIDEHGNCH